MFLKSRFLLYCNHLQKLLRYFRASICGLILVDTNMTKQKNLTKMSVSQNISLFGDNFLYGSISNYKLSNTVPLGLYCSNYAYVIAKIRNQPKTSQTTQKPPKPAKNHPNNQQTSQKPSKPPKRGRKQTVRRT